MDPTKGQADAIAMARRLADSYDGSPRIGVLAGYAGTGKSTCLRMIAEETGYPVVITPTGKAAVRVREAAGIQACTIHSWMYHPEENEQTGEVHFTKKTPDEIDRGEAGLLIIDEGSMVDENLWDDIYDVCTMVHLNILIVGDSFQLNPVQQRDGDSEFSLMSPRFKCHERVVLTEIMRQALESPIIRASMLVREGDVTGATMMLPRIRTNQLVDSCKKIYQQGGVVLCHRNETRLKLNHAVRSSLGITGELKPGEPLLVLQNQYTLQRFNGEIIKFNGWEEAPAGVHDIWDWIKKQRVQSRYGVAKFEDEPFPAVVCEEQVMGNFGHVHIAPVEKTSYTIFGKERRTNEDGEEKLYAKPFMHCNLGYALGVHKAQGGQWPSVLMVMEPSIRLNTEEGRRFFYTGLTRAISDVTLCLGVPTTI